MKLFSIGLTYAALVSAVPLGGILRLLGELTQQLAITSADVLEKVYLNTDKTYLGRQLEYEFEDSEFLNCLRGKFSIVDSWGRAGGYEQCWKRFKKEEGTIWSRVDGTNVAYGKKIQKDKAMIMVTDMDLLVYPINSNEDARDNICYNYLTTGMSIMKGGQEIQCRCSIDFCEGLIDI